MTLRMRFRPGNDVRAIWLIVLCVAAGGALYVQARYRAPIYTALDRTETLYRKAVANERLIAQAEKLRSVQRRAQQDLARLSRDTALSGTTADLLTTLHESARRFGTDVLEIDPGNAPQSAEGTLLATPLTIRVGGRFPNILRFVEDLSHHSTLIGVSDTELALASGAVGDGPEPTLDATVHATLYRLQLPAAKEMDVALPR